MHPPGKCARSLRCCNRKTNFHRVQGVLRCAHVMLIKIALNESKWEGDWP
jgi:hypothetical protein